MDTATAHGKMERFLKKMKEGEELIKKYEEELHQEVEDEEMAEILNAMENLKLRVAAKNQHWRLKYKMGQVIHEKAIFNLNSKMVEAFQLIVELTKKSENLELELDNYKTKVRSFLLGVGGDIDNFVAE